MRAPFPISRRTKWSEAVPEYRAVAGGRRGMGSRGWPGEAEQLDDRHNEQRGGDTEQAVARDEHRKAAADAHQEQDGSQQNGPDEQESAT